MFNKSGYNENLEMLIKAKKADDSVVKCIKANLDKQVMVEEKVNKTEMEIEQLNATSQRRKSTKAQTSIFNVTNYINLLTEIRLIKKQIKQKLDEVNLYNKELEEVKKKHKQLETEIDNQYKIYQENEIYTKAVEKIDKKRIDLSAEFYTEYLKHKDKYNSSIYSIEKKSKLPEPDVEALITVLNVLKKSEENEAKKAKTRKRATTTKKVGTSEEKKTTRKKATKVADTKTSKTTKTASKTNKKRIEKENSKK